MGIEGRRRLTDLEDQNDSTNPVKEYRDNLASKLKGIEDKDQKSEVLKEEKESSSYKIAEGIHRKGLEIVDIEKGDLHYSATINGKEVFVNVDSNGGLLDAHYNGVQLNSKNSKDIFQIIIEARILNNTKEKDFTRIDQLIANTEVKDLLS
jgi:hypothetical protein